MSESYRIFTVSSGKVEAGADVGTLQLKGAGVEIPAVIIGEEGRGRDCGVVPVGNPPMVPCPNRGQDLWTSAEKCEKCSTLLGEKKADGYHRPHPDSGLVRGRLLFAEVGTTKAGKPKFFSKPAATTNEKVLVVFRTDMGYRGGNDHTGDRSGWKCGKYGCDASGNGVTDAPETCPKCNATGSWDGPKLNFAPFPGEKIASGRIAQGDAGRMGSGEQLVVLMPKAVVFRTSYSGRLYGGPAAHYYVWNGEQILAATWEERAAADLF